MGGELSAAAQGFTQLQGDAEKSAQQAQATQSNLENIIEQGKGMIASLQNEVQELKGELSAAAQGFTQLQSDAEKSAQYAQAAQANLANQLREANHARQQAEAMLQESRVQNEQAVMQMNAELERVQRETEAQAVSKATPEELEGLQAKVQQQERMIDNALRLQTRAELALDRSMQEAKREMEERRRVEFMMQQLMDRLNQLPSLE